MYVCYEIAIVWRALPSNSHFPCMMIITITNTLNVFVDVLIARAPLLHPMPMALPPCLDSSTSKKSDKLLRYRRCRPSSLRDQPERQICQSNKSSPYPSLAPRPSKSLAYNKHADSLRSLCATKHDSVPIRSPPRFQCLPPPVFIAIAEALQQIASDSIEGRSAINRFGKVCKSVNEAVEPVLWKDVGWLPQYHWGERLPVNSRKWGFIK